MQRVLQLAPGHQLQLDLALRKSPSKHRAIAKKRTSMHNIAWGTFIAGGGFALLSGSMHLIAHFRHSYAEQQYRRAQDATDQAVLDDFYQEFQEAAREGNGYRLVADISAGLSAGLFLTTLILVLTAPALPPDPCASETSDPSGNNGSSSAPLSFSPSRLPLPQVGAKQ